MSQPRKKRERKKRGQAGGNGRIKVGEKNTKEKIPTWGDVKNDKVDGIVVAVSDLAISTKQKGQVLIPGLIYFKDFLSKGEEERLMADVDACKWSESISRRTQHYGYEFSYYDRENKINTLSKIADFPEHTQVISDKIYELGDLPCRFDQLIINEYYPGQGIGAHVDNKRFFGSHIASVSLGSDCVMKFQNVTTNEIKHILLARRSLVVMFGEARDNWRHEIERNKVDEFNGITIRRSRRVSLTYRTVIERAKAK
eukprot:TRINITY_DN8301_c0_g1_i1.p1 TRINITY_DN8301_c0_g1~~TRINITY_DN8301_c0_g1_i1.p1  ORF type:complete len:255 (+),score=54.89 TRINITY_DN8301_c0_g1_i1:1024-1788(+)